MKMQGRTGYELGMWPFPRPTGLDCYLARENCGLTQAQMAHELGVARRSVIYWERQGAALLVPGRLVAHQIEYMLGWGKPERGVAPLSEIYLRAHGNGDVD